MNKPSKFSAQTIQKIRQWDERSPLEVKSSIYAKKGKFYYVNNFLLCAAVDYQDLRQVLENIRKVKKTPLWRVLNQ